jgi:outer membrane cobalamin receptor
MRFQQQASLGFINVVLGGQWERRQSDSTRTLPSKVETEKSLFMQAELRLINIFMPSVSIRSISLDGENTLNSGIGVKSEIGSWLTVFADASWYDRFPTIQEQYWKDSRDSTVLPHAWINKEQHTFFQGGLNVSLGSNLRLGLTGFERKIKNAIAYIPAVTLNGSPAISISNINEVKLQGINGSIMCRWYQFELLGVMTLTRYKQADTLKTLIPDVILSGELSYRDVFFKGKFDAKFGVRSRFYKRQEGMQFDPQTLSYVQYKENIIGGSTTLDLFMILKIGDAHLSLSWENILDAEYILTPIYPMPGRHIRLGVNWVFMD